MVEKLILEATEGEAPYLDTAIKLEEIQKDFESKIKLIKEFKQEFAHQIADEFAGFEEYKGYKVSKVSGRRTISFKNIPEWNDANNNVKAVEDKYKSILALADKGVHANVSEDGEGLPLPEVSYGAETVRFTKITSK